MSADFAYLYTNAQVALAELGRALPPARAAVPIRENATLADWAAEQYRQRRHRAAIFGQDADLFGEPAWDMLLDLLSGGGNGRAISISSACIASAVAPTTALRHLTRLEERGLIQRRADPRDGRRHHVHLTERAVSKLAQVKLLGC